MQLAVNRLMMAGFIGLFAASGLAQIPELEPVDWDQYDFKPGQQVIFFDNFAADRIGDVPQAWTISQDGEVEVIEENGQFWLHVIDASTISPVNVRLPGQFTLEMDFYYTEGFYSGRYRVDLIGQNEDDWLSLTIEPPSFFFSKSAGLTSEKLLPIKTGVHHLEMAVDGSGMTCYVDNRRVINIPKAGNFSARKVELYLPGADEEIEEDNKCQFTNFTLLQGPAPMRTQLSISGKIVSYGILFDPGTTNIKRESMPTLEEFAELLLADASLSISIECHDNELENQSDNVKLSQARAEALKDFLVDEYKIPSDRLDTEGWGETRPLGEPDTVDGRKMNQRVEFIRK